MIRRHKIVRKDGTILTQIVVVEGYRPYKGAAPKQRTIQDFGYLELQKDKEAFMKKVNECNDNLKRNKEKIDVSLDQLVVDQNYSTTKNYGYKFLEAIYDFLELENFFSNIKTDAKFSLNEIIKFLVINRILYPDSKRANYQMLDNYYANFNNFELHDIYRALTILENNALELEQHLNEIIKQKIGRQTKYAYYDVTNYYFEIDYPKKSTLQAKGVSKEHVTNPIIQLGLFMDTNNLPMKMDMYQGNISDSLTLRPALEQIKKNYDLDRLIVVADKGMNSNKNIDFIIKNNDGYLFSQILKGKKGSRYHQYMFDEDGYTYNKDRSYKYKLVEEDYEYKLENKVSKHKRKILIYWKKEISEREQKKRELKINKCLKSLTNGAYLLTHEATEYLKATYSVKETGEIADVKTLDLDYEKIENDKKFDGYFCLVTSEMDMSNSDMHKSYNGLSRIEETFRISKTDILARPIYLSTDIHIKAHFRICYLSILILRLLENKLKDKLSIERMIKAIKNANLVFLNRGIVHLTFSNAIKEYNQEINKLSLTDNFETINDFKIISENFNYKADYLNLKQEKFNNLLEKIKFLP